MVTPIDAARFNKRLGDVKTITIPSASVLTMHSVGYQLMTAPANTQLAICPIFIQGKMPAQTAYASVHDLTIGFYTSVPTTLASTICTLTAAGFLDQTAAVSIFAEPFSTSALITNNPLGITCGTGDPTTGTGNLVIKITYTVHKII
jgi:hypothetical protein